MALLNLNEMISVLECGVAKTAMGKAKGDVDVLDIYSEVQKNMNPSNGDFDYSIVIAVVLTDMTVYEERHIV